jgi:hypothetical protein
LNARKALQLPAHHQTGWDAFQLIRLTLHDRADYLITVPHLLVDTVRPPQECLIGIMRWLEQISPHIDNKRIRRRGKNISNHFER